MASQELQVVLEMLRTMMPIRLDATVAEQRAIMEGATTAMPLPSDVTFEPTTAGGVPAEWTRAPGVSRERVVLYLHGGGYVIGSIKSHRMLVAGISRASGATVLSLEYRLGPEHRFPAAVDDAVAAYRWLLEQGHKPRQLAIAGDSAGGGLTVATLLALRGLPPLLVQVGTAETLLDDSTRLAANAKRDGVDLRLEQWDDMIHVFQAFAFLLPEGQQAIDGIGTFLKERLA